MAAWGWGPEGDGSQVLKALLQSEPVALDKALALLEEGSFTSLRKLLSSRRVAGGRSTSDVLACHAR